MTLASLQSFKQRNERFLTNIKGSGLIRHWTAFWTFWAGCVLVAGFLGASWVQAADESDTAIWASKVVSIQGSVLVRRSENIDWHPVQLNDIFFVGDQIRVQANSRVGIRLSNDAVLRLDQNTTLIFTEIQTQTTFVFRLIKGAIHFFSHRPRSLRILTPFVNGVVLGTEFFVWVDADQTRIDLYEGRIMAKNAFGSLQLAAGESAMAMDGKAPQRQILVRPLDSVQWALYYPPILALGTDDGSPDIEATLALVDQGRISDAIALLENLDPQAQDAPFFVLRAALRLHVGRATEAKANIHRALELDPVNGDALALQAVIAVIQNRKTDALRIAREAVRLAPRSASVRIALSYALQADFDLTGALQATQDAVTQEPGNYVAWARLAELQLSVGELDRGIAAAQKAVDLNPRMAHAHTILGFAQLTRIRTGKARETFNRAIALDSAAPLPRLGLGLATIRDGDLEQGRAQIEIAASLDPANSLIRSYLGKAYFDEKRGPLDERQFEIAKALDPNDPTPWFYDAIRKESLNRPVEALQDLQKSIERNDNRAVYRSRLLLDKDRSARGTSQARIYDELGFQQKALVESTKSLSMDPTNHSAHRFLSDTYTRVPQYQIAQVSELLQSQLLQPINTNPVQPQMAIKGLYHLASGASKKLAFNEYTSLFERSRPRLTASGVVGNHDTYGGEAVISGLSGKFSYSLGQYYYKSDGFREGSDVEHDVLDIFTQAALTDKINVQLEYRHRDTDQGDPRMSLNPNFVPNQRRDLDNHIGRIGLRVAPTRRSDVIASFIYSDRYEGFSRDSSAQIDATDDEKGYEAEAQYLFSEKQFNFILGGGIYRTDADWTWTPTLPESEKDSYAVNGENAYAYANMIFPASCTWTLGLSFETYEDTNTDFNLERVNPKLGLQWDITEKVRLRTAFIRNIKRLLAVDQTIEPTQVAGFNQFFDDVNGTLTQLFGMAADAVFTDELNGGVELYWRDLSKKDDRNEEVYRAYLYWAPHSRWSVNTAYRYERDLLHFDLKTTTIPLFIRYFDPSGLFGQCGATFVSQKEETNYDQTLSDDFVVVDAAIGYRLPQRWGMVRLEVDNVFDQNFNYRDASFKTSDKFGVVQPFVPERTVLATITLRF